jgi:type II secretory pathway pseudopilin PulG
MNLRSHIQQRAAKGKSAFTLLEIALCIGIIGFALVAIIGILPAGLQVQRDNREDTIINQEGTYLMEALKNGAEGLDELMARVEQITITNIVTGQTNTYFTSDFKHPREVVGLLSTPSDYTAEERLVHAVIYASAGAAVDARTDLAFKYQLTIRNYAFTNSATDFYSPALQLALSNHLREVRLDLRWPVLPGGKLGTGRQIFRTQVSGFLAAWPPTNMITEPLYFFRQ